MESILFPQKVLILVRHAHRDTSLGREKDNGLSKKGGKQAKLLQKYLKEINFYDNKPVLISSPSKRCVETLEPLARSLKTKIQPNLYLSEGGNLEEKANLFIQWWLEHAMPFTILCSHGDWIPVFLKITTGATIELEKAGIVELHLIGRSVQLVWVLQKLMLIGHRII
ncbi:MAG: histidine phosphatase family protein [Deltaproteobacteria bacterium]|nr:histidine phosphatase family protein [Deltaproteobacteria bacterium]